MGFNTAEWSTFTPLLLLIPAMATRTRLRPLILLAMLALIPLLVINNFRELDASWQTLNAIATAGAHPHP